MHCTRISTYEMLNVTFPELTTLAEDGILPQYAREPGFVNYGLVDVGDHKVVAISIWETREAAQKSAALADQWVKDNIANRVRLLTTQIGDLALFKGIPVTA
jgi:hypothetical protein